MASGVMLGVVAGQIMFPWFPAEHVKLPLLGPVPKPIDHFLVIFGEYPQRHEGSDNSMKQPQLFSLGTGETIHWTITGYYKLLPMPADVIKRVECMARKTPNWIFFANRQNDPDLDSNDDDDYDDPDYIPPNENHKNIAMHPDVGDLGVDTA
eukprot:jgi/Psemu1/35132/gm1.35132_g